MRAFVDFCVVDGIEGGATDFVVAIGAVVDSVRLSAAGSICMLNEGPGALQGCAKP
jgi:hypothetical protein